MRAVADMSGPDAVLAATGRPESEWFALLDAANGTELPHRELARILRDDNGVESWWSQNLAVRYEQARGMRRPGQKSDGTFAAGASRTVTATVAEAMRDVAAAAAAELGAEPDRVREHPTRPNARWRLVDGSRALVAADPVGEDRVRIGVMFEQLADEESAAPAKARASRILDAACAAAGPPPAE